METWINQLAERLDECSKQSSIFFYPACPSSLLAQVSGHMWRNIWIYVQESNRIVLPEHAEMHFGCLRWWSWFTAMHRIQCSYSVNDADPFKQADTLSFHVHLLKANLFTVDLTEVVCNTITPASRYRRHLNWIWKERSSRSYKRSYILEFVRWLVSNFWASVHASYISTWWW